MKNFSKKIEVASNIAIILVAILLGGTLVRRYLYPAPLSPQQQKADAAGRKLPQKGDPVNLADVDWGKSEKTLLVVLSTNCRYCTQSGPFYQRIVKERGDAQLIALVPQTADEGRSYLSQLNVGIDDVRQANFGDLSVRGTPTLILVDRDGKVADAWVGALPPEKENEVIGRLRTERASD